MSLFELIQLSAGIVAGYILCFWLVSVPLRNVSIVDIGWGPGFAIVAWGCWWAMPVHQTRAYVLLTLVTLWALRLGVHLTVRNIGEEEDRRYQSMRRKIGPQFWWVSLLTVFALQGVVMWTVALPVVVGLESSYWFGDLQPLHWGGIALWIVGMGFESIGDWQLARFKANTENESQVCDQGLWRYTRHPNYFGDFCVWWGHWLVSLGMWTDAWTVVSPLLMSVLLMRVSGVTLLESDISDRRPAYAEYKRRTSAFFPWFPKAEVPGD
ncbi:DUF1295 domain-containing protein [Aeoliella mucimassa]|uniref:3-oxo-5-alpha-steroid 4-dehydrogenase n=1 Tax=Aeoliella mucimassa TaxID=2527972 RepID=A0A518ANJ1_9BACT|nr:DUF1295 domain-containing protein [Aeoliella mucimassa]QDU56286.1 3-oxo-5-alpha-steroid 4-dehydrogenase [Aeoliella mucimassa]